MKIALVAAGQPRFTPDFITFMRQLKGFDEAHLYFYFWNSDWSKSTQEAKEKIEKILLPNYQLAGIDLGEQPPYQLPSHSLEHLPAKPENIHWWFKRRLGMWQSLQRSYNLIKDDYDMIIKFRLDGRLFNDLDLRTLDVTNNDILFSNHGLAGFNDFKVSDLFSVCNKKGADLYFNCADHFVNLVPICDPTWELNGHGTWSSEHVFGRYLQMNGMKQPVFGDFKFHINWNGRSKYTDKHYHHPVLPDPTSN
jgi:hypothetical protein